MDLNFDPAHGNGHKKKRVRPFRTKQAMSFYSNPEKMATFQEKTAGFRANSIATRCELEFRV